MEQTIKKPSSIFRNRAGFCIAILRQQAISRREQIAGSNSLADDVARLLTVKREDGNLITWLGTYRTSRTSTSYISLKTMITPILSKLLEHYDNPPQAFLLNQCLQYAAYTRFSFIEHEAKVLSGTGKNSEGNFRQFAAFNKFEWSKLDYDQVRLFKAALQSDENAKLVREALVKQSRIAAFKEILSDEIWWERLRRC
ncbi:hypothetical protein Plhal304r1_c013g0050121 [Plasmopara halstedii]